MIAKITFDGEFGSYVKGFYQDKDKTEIAVTTDIVRALIIKDKKTKQKLKKLYKSIVRKTKAKELKPRLVFIDEEDAL